MEKKPMLTRQPQRSEAVSGNEDKDGLIPIAAEKKEAKAITTGPLRPPVSN